MQNKHWTGHQGRMQPPLTGAHKNNVIVRATDDNTSQRKQETQSSEDEIANVNFLYDDILHALQNTIRSCINSARDRRGYVLERRFTKVIKITQCNGHYAMVNSLIHQNSKQQQCIAHG